jgi:large subunit ribosomal protein L18
MNGNLTMAKTSKKTILRERRKVRGRKKIEGTTERPRISIYRSDAHISAQVIDDSKGVTLAAVSSYEKGNHRRANITVCTELGKALAERCKAKNISTVVFDKNGFTYHGRVKALADGAREGGLLF